MQANTYTTFGFYHLVDLPSNLEYNDLQAHQYDNAEMVMIGSWGDFHVLLGGHGTYLKLIEQEYDVIRVTRIIFAEYADYLQAKDYALHHIDQAKASSCNGTFPDTVMFDWIEDRSLEEKPDIDALFQLMVEDDPTTLCRYTWGKCNRPNINLKALAQQISRTNWRSVIKTQSDVAILLELYNQWAYDDKLENNDVKTLKLSQKSLDDMIDADRFLGVYKNIADMPWFQDVTTYLKRYQQVNF